MAIFEAIAYAAAEGCTFVAGKVTGKVFKIEPQTAQKAGELIVVLLFGLVGLIVTLVYS